MLWSRRAISNGLRQAQAIFTMLNLPLIAIGKTISKMSQTLNRGNGSTWPGHIALKGNPNFIKDIISKSHLQVIIVAGTNGKTTTSALIKTGLEKNQRTVLQNESGANLLNGIASTLIQHCDSAGKLTQDFAIFEIDENVLPLILKQVTPDYLILLNLFRDQLDRYGELNTVTTKWKEAIDTLPEKTKIILNADDPQIAFLGEKRKALYFGLSDLKYKKSNSQQAPDSLSCPRCAASLIFEHITFSHLGNWHCNECRLERPKTEQDNFSYYPLPGTYNQYNTHAAVLVLKAIGFKEKQITDAFNNFTPAFGRQEKINYHEKNVQLFLSKNPTSFNQSYTTIKELGAKTLLLVLNDRVPDGRDISWIWDVDLPEIEKFSHILIAGDRVYDMALRIKYEDYKNFQPFENLEDAINAGIDLTKKEETFFILPTYSAMLEVRKILTGKKIL